MGTVRSGIVKENSSQPTNSGAALALKLLQSSRVSDWSIIDALANSIRNGDSMHAKSCDLSLSCAQLRAHQSLGLKFSFVLGFSWLAWLAPCLAVCLPALSSFLHQQTKSAAHISR